MGPIKNKLKSMFNISYKKENKTNLPEIIKGKLLEHSKVHHKLVSGNYIKRFYMFKGPRNKNIGNDEYVSKSRMISLVHNTHQYELYIMVDTVDDKTYMGKISVVGSNFFKILILNIYESCTYNIKVGGTYKVTYDEVATMTIIEKLGIAELKVIKALNTLGFKYIARDNISDETCGLFAYEKMPIRRSSHYIQPDGNVYKLKKDIFQSITWEDQEPTSIDDLLIKESE